MFKGKIAYELAQWQHKMQRPPSWAGRASKAIQDKINSIIPEKVHDIITAAIKQMTRGVLYGAGYTTKQPEQGVPFETREQRVLDRISFYKKAGAAEGGITGAGGFWLALAEFPVLIGIKMKLLFDIAALYGYNVDDYRERLFILHVFQLAYSSQKNRRIVYQSIVNWDEKTRHLPDDIHQFDWLTFQQEYRDYIDLAKMAQLIPGIGAAVGLVVNYRLLNHLGKTAMNAYRMRYAEAEMLKTKPDTTLLQNGPTI